MSNGIINICFYRTFKFLPLSLEMTSKIHNSVQACSSSVDQNNLEKLSYVQDFAKRMLKGRFFIGSFQEKRYVANINAYRDLIVVSKEEWELIKDLQVVKRRIRSVYRSSWIGITTPETIGAPAGHCLWVDLQDEVFGSYWYKIKSVRFCDTEILLTIKIIRPVNLHDESNAPSVDSISNYGDCISSLSQNYKSVFAKVQYFLLDSCSYFFKNVATLTNIKSAIVFAFILIATVGTACVHVLRHSPEYFLKLLRELSGIIKAITPIVVVCIETLGKIVGGILLLIAMLRGRSDHNLQNANQINRKLMITNGPNNYAGIYRPSISNGPNTRRYGQSLTITEICD